MTYADEAVNATSWFSGGSAALPNEQARQSDLPSFVLVLDDDVLRRAALACAVLRIGRVAVLAISSRECRAVVATLVPALVVCVPDAAGELPEEVVELLAMSDKTACIVIGHDRADGFRDQLPDSTPRLHYVGVPPPIDMLTSIIRKYIPDASIAPFSPAEYVQLAGLGAHSVALHCLGPGGEDLGRIVMQRGRVRSARSGLSRGFEAFASLVTRTDARVCPGDMPAPDDSHPDLDGDWQSLVLESMRRYDEGLRGAPRDGLPQARRSERESDFSALFSDSPPDTPRHPLARTASIPALPVTEMRDALSSSRAMPNAEVRDLVEQGVRAVIEQDYERAIHALERALAADPKSASVRHRLDRLYAIVRRPQQR